MPPKTGEAFSFVVEGLPAETFIPVRFKGEEALSRPYRFEILMLSKQPHIDPGAVLNHRAKLVINHDPEPVFFNGLPRRFEQGGRVRDLTVYRTVLVPKFRFLGLSEDNQVFLDQTTPEFLDAALRDGGLDPDDYEFRLARDYPRREYVCQYGESNLDFVHRRMEFHGLYYFFEQLDRAEKLVITDSLLAHVKRPGVGRLLFVPPEGLSPADKGNIVFDFSRASRRTSAEVRLKDYNYRKPGLDIVGEAGQAGRRGPENFLYGEHAGTPEESLYLARIRSESLSCRGREFSARGYSPYISPGYLFELAGRLKTGRDLPFLAVEVIHQGEQAGFLQPGRTRAAEGSSYVNTFKGIPQGVQFRPEQATKRPRVSGVINARIDGQGEGRYAELDNQGRYKVRLPFDLAGRAGGKASHWVRLAQPYAGPNYGFHCPLHKGCEVILTFVNGDPDRPIIAAAVPNPDNASPVTMDEQASNILRTAGGNKIVMIDEAGAQGVFLSSPKSNTWMSLGRLHENGKQAAAASYRFGWNKKKEGGWAPLKNHDDGFALGTDSTWGKYIGQDLNLEVWGNKMKMVVGGAQKYFLGAKNRTVAGLFSSTTLGGRITLMVPTKWEKNNLHVETQEELIELIKSKIETAQTKILAADTKLSVIKSTTTTATTKKLLAQLCIDTIQSKKQILNRAISTIQTEGDAMDLLIEQVNKKIETSNATLDVTTEKVIQTRTAVKRFGVLFEKGAQHVEQVATNLGKMGCSIERGRRNM
ncbi:MAG: type VI secretion system tip protein TssI/VgrG [Pseudomonadota bacterium]